MTDAHPDNPYSEPAFLRVRGLTKRYWVLDSVWQRRKQLVSVNDVTFEIHPGTTLAMVGRSGSGKSTVARCVTCLERPDAGEIWLDGAEISQLGSRELVPFRTKIQMVFQDPATAMNPRMSAAEI